MKIPLLGPTKVYLPLSALTTTPSRSVPTPGSTTATNIVLVGKAGTASASTIDAYVIA